MWNNLLWIINANYQYKQQKANGLAGFVGILLAIFMFWKWDSLFYPILYKLGIVAFADRVGLVSENPLLTTFNVVYLLFVLCLFFAISAFLIMAIGVAFKFLDNSKFGSHMMGLGIIILLSPILLPYLFILQFRIKNSPEIKYSLRNTYLNDPTLTPIYNEFYKDKDSKYAMIYLYEQQMARELELPYHDIYELLRRHLTEDTSPSISNLIRSRSESDVSKELNRAVASIKDDVNLLTGYCPKDKLWYILFPNPLPAPYSKSVRFNPFRPTLGFLEFKSSPLKEGFMVPAIPFEYVWNIEELRVEPKIIENSKVTMKNTAEIAGYEVKTDEMMQIFKEVAQRQDVYDWVYAAHVTYQLIPIVYGPTHTERYMELAREIPYADIYAPIYSSGVRDAILFYEKEEWPWAINWVRNNFVRENFNEGTNFG